MATDHHQPNWLACLADYVEALAEERRLSAIHDDALAAVKAEAPMPEILVCQDGGGMYLAASSIEHADLPFDRKVELMVALRAWQPVFEASYARHGVEAASEAWEDASDALEAASKSLINAPARDSADFVFKFRVYLDSVHCTRTRHDIDTADTLSELLSDPHFDGAWPLARLYQDALRLAGERPDLQDAQPFDDAAWVAAFEALPGHSIWPTGPVYAEPDAFPGGDPKNAPTGGHLWDALTEWQRDSVLDFAKTRAG